MSSTPVPTLSPNGWVNTPEGKTDILMSHFFVSEESQSYLYAGNITSLPAIINKYCNDIDKCCSAIAGSLEEYLARYFDMATAEVTSDVRTVTGTSVSISVYCSIVDQGMQYSVGHLINVTDSKINKIIKLNNTGIA